MNELHGHGTVKLFVDSYVDGAQAALGKKFQCPVFRMDYKCFGRWGTVARSRDPGLHGRKPVFKSLRTLVDSYFDPYVDFSGRIIGYGVGDLNDLGRYDWRFSKRNVWKVERTLRDAPHRALRTSDRRYIRLRSQYQEFLKTHEAHDTPFTQGSDRWM